MFAKNALAPRCSLPFGVSILILAEKKSDEKGQVA
jgi:hypothetical protein